MTPSGGTPGSRAAETESDEQRTDRLVGWLMAIGGAVLVLGKAVPELAHAHDYPAWWNALGAIQAALVLLFAAAGWVLPFAALRAGWLAVPILAAFLQVTAFAGYTGRDADLALPWPWTFEAVGVSYLVLWLRPWAAIAAVFVSGSLTAVSGLLFLGFIPAQVAALTPVHFTNLGFVAIFIGIRAQVNRFRRSQAEAIRQRERQARARAEALRQAHLSRVVHDEILSVLTASLTLTGSPHPALRQSASNALGLLHELPGTDLLDPGPGQHDAEQSDARQAVDDLVARLRDLDPSCRVEISVAAGSLPRPVIHALSAASSEAVRNSLRHAGVAAVRTVRVTAAPVSVIILITDTGAGFDPSAVDPRRLGIQDSIVARMRAIGGEATVRAAIGAGTEVLLRWPE